MGSHFVFFELLQGWSLQEAETLKLPLFLLWGGGFFYVQPEVWLVSLGKFDPALILLPVYII